MDKPLHPLARAVSHLLIYTTALTPLHPAFAAGINAANGNTQVIIKPGNVPVVNIATPNGAGISHNTYKDFNVGTPGAVLNNATQGGKTQLGVDIINGNPNLKGKSAELIINEVTGGSRSELQGKLEVFGNKANVMIANPNGITCDGCGFINAPGVTLTTGKPQFDKQGALEALEVKKGGVTIGGKGLDGSGADYVDILSRATELNGKINAQNLSLTQGANRINFKDGTVKPIAGDGAKPQLAVDTKALGGMYANKIRLVATEDGVGINLKDLDSKQRDITLSVNGKIALSGTTHSKTDLNVSARELHVTPGTIVQADGNATLAATTLVNNGQVTTSGDMRIFSNHVRNAGDNAKLHANKSLWMQRDAQGNKASYVENRSATIKTNSGDLVIRTEKLDNVRDRFRTQTTPVAPDSTAVKSLYPGEGFSDLAVLHFKGEDGKKWFGEATDDGIAFAVNDGRNTLSVAEDSAPGKIVSGANLYINATELWNHVSDISSAKDLILTGNNLNSWSQALGSRWHWADYVMDEDENRAHPFPQPGFFDPDRKEQTWMKKLGEGEYWVSATAIPATLSAGGNLVADFKNAININTPLPYEVGQVHDVTVATRADNLSGNNILLHAGSVYSTDIIRSRGDLTVIADDKVNTGQAQLLAGQDLSVTAVNNIDAWQSVLRGRDITLVSRNGETKIHTSQGPLYFHPDGVTWAGELSATRDLVINAGKNIYLLDTLIGKSRNKTLTANQNITVENGNEVVFGEWSAGQLSDEQRQAAMNRLLPMLGQLVASDNITLNSGDYLSLSGRYIATDKGDITLTAARDIHLNSRALEKKSQFDFDNERTPELRTQLHAGGRALLSAGRDIAAQGAELTSGSDMSLIAGNNIWLAALAYSAINRFNDNNKDDRQLTPVVRSGKRLTLAANGWLSTAGAELNAGGDMTLTSRGDMRFESAETHSYREEGNAFTESRLHKGTTLNSGGILTLIAGGSVLFQAAKLTAKSALDVAAKGGWLYAQAQEESNHYEKTEKKRKWWGKKTEVKQTRHDVTNKVTEFTAGGDINLLSREDSTYEASKIAAGQNARLTSTQGKVNFRAVKNTTFEQTVTSSKGIYITQSNRGYEDNKWVLPSIYTGGALTVEAANGVSADVKVKNGQTLRNAVAALGNAPGTTWLKDLDTRKDVQWNTVRDAYSSWDYKSQHLNPAVAAVIAIAAAAVTAGAGLAAAAGQSAVTATGVAGATASSAVYGSAYAGMTSLASQVAVALVDNQGNLSKTLQALGSNETVKATATAMAIGGALAGFDQVLDANVPADKARLPALIKDEGWSKIAQRVAGQSVISSSLNTAINGGSFRDNLTTALLTNVGSQLQAEGANLIGDNGDILNVPGRAVSHAVLAGISAEIGRGDGKGAAAGALAAELAGFVMQGTLFEPANLNEKERQLYRLQEALNGNEAKEQTARVIGALTGALTTHTPEGAYSGADSAQSVYRYNMTDHMFMQFALDNQKDILAADKGDKDAAKRVAARREGAAAVAVIGGGGMVLTAGGLTLLGAAPELVAAARLVITGCKTNPALCLNQAGIYAADIAAPDAAIGTGAIASSATLVVGKTQDAAKKLAQQTVKTVDESLKSKVFNTQPVADLVKAQSAADARLSAQAAEKLQALQKTSTDQLVKVFDPKQNESKLNVFGQQFEQVLGGGNKSGTTKVFSTERLSNREILDYAQSLAGAVPLEEKQTPLGLIYVAKNDGMTINLRKFSSSKDETKARWTIDIIGNESLKALQGKVKKKIEIKFR